MFCEIHAPQDHQSLNSLKKKLKIYYFLRFLDHHSQGFLKITLKISLILRL